MKGTVLAVKQREKGYSINLDDGEWYSGFGKSSVNKGDIVEFEFEKSSDGQWNNIKKIEVKDKAVSSNLQDKALTMLVAYAKDEVVAILGRYKPSTEDNPEVMKALWKEANEHVWTSYNYFKEKLKGEKPKEDPKEVSSEEV